MGLPRPWLGRVHKPEYMRPEVWSDAGRLAIVDHLTTSTDPDVLTWATLMSTATKSEFFDEFKSKLQMHDQYRNTDFNTTFSELTKYL
jgi:hypothetical protein